jgi:hypothetical protein
MSHGLNRCDRRDRQHWARMGSADKSKWGAFEPQESDREMSLRPHGTDPFEVGGVDSVNTFGFRPGNTWVGSGRIPHVFARSQCFQGLECSSSPTSGTAYPLVRGVFALTC